MLNLKRTVLYSKAETKKILFSRNASSKRKKWRTPCSLRLKKRRERKKWPNKKNKWKICAKSSVSGPNWALTIKITQASLAILDYKIVKQPPRSSNRTVRHITTAISSALWDPILAWGRRSLQALLTSSHPHLWPEKLWTRRLKNLSLLRCKWCNKTKVSILEL